MTIPDTTPMPNDTAKILIQKFEMRRYTGRRVTRCRPSSTAMYEASPIVNAGSRKWNATTNANCSRDRTSASRLTPRLVCQASGDNPWRRGSLVLFLHVCPRRRSDALVLAIAERLLGRNLLAGLLVQPARPHRPPASRHFLRRLEPSIGIGTLGAVEPVAAFLLGRRIDDACDVSARA